MTRTSANRKFHVVETSAPDQIRRSGALTFAEIRGLPAAVDVVTAGRCFGIGRNMALRLAKTGELAVIGDVTVPVLKLGRAYRVPLSYILAALKIPAT